MTTKKASSKPREEMRAEYNLAELKNPVRGKYHARAVEGTNVVLLDPERRRGVSGCEVGERCTSSACQPGTVEGPAWPTDPAAACLA